MIDDDGHVLFPKKLERLWLPPTPKKELLEPVLLRWPPPPPLPSPPKKPRVRERDLERSLSRERSRERDREVEGECERRFLWRRVPLAWW